MKKYTTSDRLKQIMSSQNLKQVDILNKCAPLCKKYDIKIGKNDLSQYVSGKVSPGQDKLSILSMALGVSEVWLMGYEESEPQAEQNDLFTQLDIMPISKKKLPILGNAACGEPKYAEQTFEGYVTVGADMQADFCLYAKGDSMVNARIHDGDIVFVRKQDIVEDGEIAVVLVEDDTTIKRVYYDRENNVLTLVPENPAFKIMRYMGAELNQIRILGKVIAGQYNVG